MKGKCAETFGPLGPWLVTRDEIEDVQDLAMSLDVNGERRQTGNTKTMIFGIAHCLHYISQFMVLEPGDVVTTGTPPGVALGMKPPMWLKAGDAMTLKIARPRRAEAEGRAVQGIDGATGVTKQEARVVGPRGLPRTSRRRSTGPNIPVSVYMRLIEGVNTQPADVPPLPEAAASG